MTTIRLVLANEHVLLPVPEQSNVKSEPITSCSFGLDAFDEGSGRSQTAPQRFAGTGFCFFIG